MSTAHGNFSVGDIVHHLKFDYRGVVIDVDPVFDGSEGWYEQVALSRPPKDRPWYHVLTDTGQQTYVAERHLESDSSGDPVEHPLLTQFFSGFQNGRYVPRTRPN
jgi:heat shock protein HspQ